ncbi:MULTISPECIES: GNAT family N-acetyltransferase [Bacillus]|uniref:GNAT family N-acetyltransferase n=1 Tax=Bacillus TaxID=1386 RepID=UPI000BB6E1B3|nr:MULTISPECIES: GNAT family protein [Bacillus]
MIDLKQFVMAFEAKDNSSVKIRPLETTDASDLVESVRTIVEAGSYIQKDVPRTVEEEEAFIMEMKKKKNMYVGVEWNGKVVGLARVIRGEIKMKKHTGLFRTWLTDEVQGLGIGKKIMEYTDKWCMENNVRKLCLTVFASNEVAYNLYEKYGFIKEGVQIDQAYINGVYDDEIWMGKFYEVDNSVEQR